jgi:MFS superfamily sulfate permease-like transporter
MQDVDLRVQLPYFLIRLAALVVITVVLAVVGVNLLLAVLIGFAVAGLLTWPLGRMQRRAAQRSAAAKDAAGPLPPPPPPAAGKGGGKGGGGGA